MRCKYGKVKSGPRKGRCRKTKVGRCRQYAKVYKPSLGREVTVCTSYGARRGPGGKREQGVYGPVRPSGLFGLGDFLGFL